MLLKRELAVFQGAEAHQDMPLALILLRLGLISDDFSSKEESRAPLFDVAFSWQKTPPGSRLPFEVASIVAGSAEPGVVADLRSLRLESCGNLSPSTTVGRMAGRDGVGSFVFALLSKMVGDSDSTSPNRFAEGPWQLLGTRPSPQHVSWGSGLCRGSL